MHQICVNWFSHVSNKTRVKVLYFGKLGIHHSTFGGEELRVIQYNRNLMKRYPGWCRFHMNSCSKLFKVYTCFVHDFFVSFWVLGGVDRLIIDWHRVQVEMIYRKYTEVQYLIRYEAFLSCSCPIVWRSNCEMKHRNHPHVCLMQIIELRSRQNTNFGVARKPAKWRNLKKKKQREDGEEMWMEYLGDKFFGVKFDWIGWDLFSSCFCGSFDLET